MNSISGSAGLKPAPIAAIKPPRLAPLLMRNEVGLRHTSPFDTLRAKREKQIRTDMDKAPFVLSPSKHEREHRYES